MFVFWGFFWGGHVLLTEDWVRFFSFHFQNEANEIVLLYKGLMQINYSKILRGCDKRSFSNYNLYIIIVSVSEPSPFVFYLKGSQPLLDYHPCARVQIRHQMVSTGAFMMSESTTSCRISRIYRSSPWESFLAANPVTSASMGFADPWRKRV